MKQIQKSLKRNNSNDVTRVSQHLKGVKTVVTVHLEH